MKKKIFIIGLLIIIIFFVMYFNFFTTKKSNYVFGKVEKKNITGLVSESGSITNGGGVYVYSSTTGVIGKVFVSNGNVVTEKQKLFTVKSTATPQEKAESYALYRAAKSAVQQAENDRRKTLATVDRVHDDLKNKATTETFLEKETRTIAEVAHDNAWDTLVSAQANLASAQTKYLATQNSTATAPISGQIFNLSATDGSQVSVNTPLAPTIPVLFIKSFSPAEILLTVGENEINKIALGQKADIRLDAVENKTYHAEVERFDQIGTMVENVPKYNVYLSILDPDDNLRPGMTADADIVTNELTAVLTVPNAAIKPYQKGRAVQVLDSKNKIKYLPVKIGVRGKEYTQIIEGLNEGQQIIISLASEQAPKSSFFKF